VEVWQTSSLRRLRLGEEKKKKEKKLQHENILVCPVPYRATVTMDKNREINELTIAALLLRSVQ